MRMPCPCQRLSLPADAWLSGQPLSKALPLISSPVTFSYIAKIRLQDMLKAGVSVSVSVPAIDFLKPCDDRYCCGDPVQGVWIYRANWPLLWCGTVLLLFPLPFGCVLSLECNGFGDQLQSYLLVLKQMYSVANPSKSRCRQL